MTETYRLIFNLELEDWLYSPRGRAAMLAAAWTDEAWELLFHRWADGREFSCKCGKTFEGCAEEADPEDEPRCVHCHRECGGSGPEA